MFARAPRFPKDNKHVDTLPGPGEYDPRSPESKKRGAFLEKDERFRQYRDKDAADNFGAYTHVDCELDLPPIRPRSASSNINNDAKVQQQIESFKVQHEKELQTLQAQLDKQTKAREESERKGKEAERLRKENKTLVAKEASLKHELSVAQQQLSLVPSLRSKFDALVQQHTSSKEKYATSVSSLNDQVTSWKGKHTAECAETEGLKLEAAAKGREISRLEVDIVKTKKEKETAVQEAKAREEQLKEAKQDLEYAATAIDEMAARYERLDEASRQQTYAVAAGAHRLLASQKECVEGTLQDLKTEKLALTYANHRLTRKLKDRGDQVQELVELVMVLEEEKADLLDRTEELESDLEAQRSANVGLERLLQSTIDDHAEEVRDLQERVETILCVQEAQLNEHALQERIAVAQEYELDLVHDELALCREKTQELVEAKLALADELSGTKEELAKIHDDLHKAEDRLEEQHVQIEELQANVAHLEGDLSTALEVRHTLEADLANEREQRRRITGLLTQSQATEQVLQGEITSLQHDLIDYVQLQETNEELVKALDRVIRTSTLAQDDAQELARLNAELTGHSNPSQKIRHLDRIRTELGNLKKAHIATQSELSSARRQIETLQSEINAYKAVDSNPAIIRHHLGNSRLTKSVSMSVLRDVAPAQHTANIATSATANASKGSAGNSLLKVPQHHNGPTGGLRGKMSISELR